jgi:tetratricopeptide (TPR) repeat protein
MKTIAMLIPTFLALSIASGLPSGRSARAADGDVRAAAREHFQKGVAAYADQRFAEAADEFEAAYRLSPAFKLLYNIGQVSVALGRSVEAVDAFDKYLKQGASAISAERKAEVTAELEKQQGRIGTISLRTFPEAADVRLDGVLLGQTPLPRPVRVNAGKHTLEAILVGFTTKTREVDVAGKAQLSIEMTLEKHASPTPAPVAAAKSEPIPAPAPPVAPAPVVQPLVERVVIETPPAPTAPRNDGASFEPAPRAPRAESSSVSWQRIAGVVVTVGGLATATVGGLMIYKGVNQANDARDRLNMTDPANDAAWNTATADFNAGKSLNRRGWTVGGIGAAVTLGGIILIAAAPDRSNAVSLASWVTTESGGAVLRGVW